MNLPKGPFKVKMALSVNFLIIRFNDTPGVCHCELQGGSVAIF